LIIRAYPLVDKIHTLYIAYVVIAFSDKTTREELIGRNVEQVDNILIYYTKPEISWRNRGKEPNF
jgi:hypothetical protein